MWEDGTTALASVEPNGSPRRRGETGGPDVVVVGAGPGGVSAAVYLTRAGFDVLLLDRARFPRGKACAECLSPQASRILDDLGVLTELERSGAAQLEGMAVRAPDGTWIVGEYAGLASYTPYRPRSLAVRREVLDTILLGAARAAGVRVLEGVRVADVVRNGLSRIVGVRGTSREGPIEVRARLVIGADGLRSTIARRTGLTRVARFPRRIALVAHYEGVRGLGPFGEMHVEHDGFVGIADVGSGVTTVALVVPALRAPEMAGDKAGFLAAWLAARPQLAPRFASARLTGSVWATGPFASQAPRAWTPGAALVGDAADFFDPFTGEGIYAALRGGEILAGHASASLRAMTVARGDRLLASYDDVRRREFGGKWKVERIIGAVVGCPPLMNRAARALATRTDLADLLVGVTGDFVPASALLNARYVMALCVRALFGSRVPPSARPFSL